MFIDYRVFYTKTGRLKYISHLDVNRLMQRALKRSGLPVWYSEGFNPHIYITFALPLALGLESRYEIMDFRLTANLPEKRLPVGFSALCRTEWRCFLLPNRFIKHRMWEQHFFKIEIFQSLRTVSKKVGIVF